METMNKPDTAPALNAVCNAPFKDFIASDAVLIFALIEIHIPMYPEATELNAPSINENDAQNANSGF